MNSLEGVLQYRLEHRRGDLPPDAVLDPLFRWFRACRSRGLIGRDPARYDGLAFGNISVRAATGFVISGTQTGGRESLGPDDLAWVLDFDAAHNRLTATGPARPSSEAMTHGQVYRALPAVNAVIHVHSPEIWARAAALGLPVTGRAAGYGTPEMAAEVERLLAPPAGVPGMIVMGGHVDGVISYGADMDTAGELLLAALARASARSGRGGRASRGSAHA
jgi:hypothetical protein